MEKNIKQKKGITLIALVITIIVLLILAGVTIAMLTGQNGILTNANNANMQSDYFQAEERMRLAYMSVKTDIMSKRVNDGTYDARTDGDNLKTLVANDLQGAKGWGAVTYDSTNKAIKVTYTSTAIKKDGITTGKPASDGKVEFEIVLTEKNAELKVDGVAVNSSAGTSSGASVDEIFDSGEFIGLLSDTEGVFKYENNYYKIDMNNNVTRINVEKYFLIEGYEGNNQVFFYGNDVETWTDFFASPYSSSCGFGIDDEIIEMITKGDGWYLRKQSHWVNVNDSIINGDLYRWDSD